MALDILIWVVIGAGAILGFVKGLIGQIGQIVAVIAGVVGARIFGERMARFFAGSASPDMVDYVCAYIAVFIIAYFLFWLIARLLRKTIGAVHLGIVDRLGGAIFKAALWALILSICLNLYLILKGNANELNHPAKPWREAVIKFAPAVLGYIK